MDGSVDYDRNWKSYKEGFGNVVGEYWLDNDITKKEFIARNVLGNHILGLKVSFCSFKSRMNVIFKTSRSSVTLVCPKRRLFTREKFM